MSEVVKSPAEIFSAAKEAAQVAYEGEKSRLVPMVVGSAIGLSNEIDYSQRTYFVAGGPCGFSWVTIRPARGKFVNWLKANGLGSKAYGGGWQLWSSKCVSESRSAEFGQSMQLKDAACQAFAAVLRENGLEAYAGSRMD